MPVDLHRRPVLQLLPESQVLGTLLVQAAELQHLALVKQLLHLSPWVLAGLRPGLLQENLELMG